MPPHLEKNVSGPFYTTGECLACGIPEHEAPELFAPLDDDNYQTYFVRQPVTSAEVERACRAAEGCCVGAVRYGGQDAAIIRRLGNTHDYCDYIVADNEDLKLLDHWPLQPARRKRKFWWQFWK
jgi:ferredoxin